MALAPRIGTLGSDGNGRWALLPPVNASYPILRSAVAPARRRAGSLLHAARSASILSFPSDWKGSFPRVRYRIDQAFFGVVTDRPERVRGARFVPKQAFLRLVEEEQQQEGGAFDPADIAVMTIAFDLILADLKLVNRNDPIVWMVAKLVIELVRNGERDPERLRQQVVDQYSGQR